MAIKLSKPSVHRWTTDHLRVSAPVLVLVGYLLLYALVELGQFSALRLVLAFVLAVFASGYSLVALLFAQGAGFDPVERLALAGCVSLALGGMMAYCLARLPSGLHLTPFLVATGLFNLGCYLAIRCRRRTAVQRVALPLSFPLQRLVAWWMDQNVQSRVTTLALLVLLAAGGWRLHSATLDTIPDPAMIEFYLLDENGAAQNYPHVTVAGETAGVIYGVVNRTQEAVDCRILASTDGDLLASGTPLHLAPGQAYQAGLKLKIPERANGLTRVDFTLVQQNGAWRTLWLWLDVTPEDR
jgi:uncharacterized membrane protein